jgi:hypothetical protein
MTLEMKRRVSSAIEVCTAGTKSGNAVLSLILFSSEVSPSHCSEKLSTISRNSGLIELSALKINVRAAASS